jgi:biotin transport system ATP-binding protein
MVELESLSFAYERELVLHDLSFRIRPGRTVVLAGANGSGKSTLLALLTGIYTPSRGRLRVGEHCSPGQESRLRSAVGLLLQDAELQILGATVREDLLLGCSPEGAGSRSWADLARSLGLDRVLDAPVQTLSGGQRRKLCLAAILLRDPRLLLFDEPFSGLDYPAVRELRGILAENRSSGITQIVAAHDLEPIVDLADDLIILHHGRLACSGTPAEVLDRAAELGVRPPCSWQMHRELRPWD